MTKKHFVAMATAMKLMRTLTKSPTERAGMDKAIHILANVCAGFNVNFDYGRFVKACGL